MGYLMRSLIIVLGCQVNALWFSSKIELFVGFKVLFMHYGSSQAVTIHWWSEMLHCIVGCLLRSMIFILGSPEVNDLCSSAKICLKLCICQNFGQWQCNMKYPVQPISFHSEAIGIATRCEMPSEFNNLICRVKIAAKIYALSRVYDSTNSTMEYPMQPVTFCVGPDSVAMHYGMSCKVNYLYSRVSWGQCPQSWG